MPRQPTATELTLSVRLIWPVARALDGNPIGDEMLTQLGIGPEQFVDPETRVSAQLSFDQLQALSERLHDPLIGLRSGQAMDLSDFDVLEHAARACPNLLEAQNVMWRYIGLMHDGLRMRMRVEGERYYSHYGYAPGLRSYACVNDFVIATTLGFSRRNMAAYVAPLEVRMAHARPTYAEHYAEYLGCPVSFDAPHGENVIVMNPQRALGPMRASSRALSVAFEGQAQRLLGKLRGKQSFSARVHADIAAHLSGEQVSMDKTAQRLELGVATLRRRLEDEGTTFSEILDTLRKELAEHHLSERALAIGEIAFLLGFSDVRAFGRAFKRWSQVAPSEYRAGKRAGSD
jgi:AraC-like DNA-binding protein